MKDFLAAAFVIEIGLSVCSILTPPLWLTGHAPWWFGVPLGVAFFGCLWEYVQEARRPLPPEGYDMDGKRVIVR